MEKFDVLHHILFIKQVRLIVTNAFIIVKKSHQQSWVIYFPNFVFMQIRTVDVKGQKHMNSMCCHAANIHLPKEIFVAFESLLLSELMV